MNWDVYVFILHWFKHYIVHFNHINIYLYNAVEYDLTVDHL
jgi:hypothetical protein